LRFLIHPELTLIADLVIRAFMDDYQPRADVRGTKVNVPRFDMLGVITTDRLVRVDAAGTLSRPFSTGYI